jgi:UDP-3-O-[3-hydroxymyristoyl] glucosamine N-acyltransferase
MKRKSFTLEELAQLTNSRLIGSAEYQILDVAPLESATHQDASFLANPRYESAMKKSTAGVIFIAPSVPLIDGRNFLINDNPSQAFQKVVEAFHANATELTGFKNIHQTAVVDPSATIGSNVQIGPHAVIDKDVKIGNNSFIGAGCYIGPSTFVGNDCIIHPNVTIRERCILGNRVILQPGVIIGGCGFGYLTNTQGKHTKLAQVGNVEIEDDVEIGSNTTIDRARFKTTRIGRGSKIDNLVQIGHAVEIGPDNIIVAQTGIAGSTVTGQNVTIGGQVAIAGHLRIGAGVMIAGRSGVSKSLPEAGKYGGVPARSLNEYNRNSVHLHRIEEYVQIIKELEKRVKALEDDFGVR